MKIYHINGFISSLKSFKKRGGFHIFLSTIISKIIGMVVSLLVVRLISKNDYGIFSYALSFIKVLLPFAGLGLNHSFLRYGGLQETLEAKYALFKTLFYRGIIYSIIGVFILCLASPLIPFKIEGTRLIFCLLSVQIITTYMYDISNNYLRVLKLNKKYANSAIIFSVLYLAFNLMGTNVWGINGLITAKIITPLVTTCLIFISIKTCIKPLKKTKIKSYEYEKYGFHVGIGSIASQLLYSLDLIMLGIFTVNSDAIAEYRVATIIPFSLLFIPKVLMQTDFVTIAEKYRDIDFLKRYSKKVSVLMCVVAVVLFIIGILFSKLLVIQLFGEQYRGASEILNVLLFGLIGAFSCRIPFGNILAAVGMSKQSAIIAYIILCVNVFLNILLIKKYGVVGAAISTSLVMWLSGIISLFVFKNYLNKLHKPACNT